MMVAVLLFLIQSVSSLIIRSNIDRIDNITCSDELPIAASIFGQGDLKCLAPHDIYKNSEFRDVNIIEWIEFRYHHFEKYIYTDLEWKKEDFYSYRYNNFIEVRPMIGCLRMLKRYSHVIIFRTYGKDPRNPSKHWTTSSTPTLSGSQSSTSFVKTTRSRSTTEPTRTRVRTTEIISSNAPTKFATGTISRTEAPTAPITLEITVSSCLAVILSIVTVYCVIRQNRRRLRVVGHIYEDNTELDNIIETESTV